MKWLEEKLCGKRGIGSKILGGRVRGDTEGRCLGRYHVGRLRRGGSDKLDMESKRR